MYKNVLRKLDSLDDFVVDVMSGEYDFKKANILDEVITELVTSGIPENNDELVAMQQCIKDLITTIDLISPRVEDIGPDAEAHWTDLVNKKR